MFVGCNVVARCCTYRRGAVINNSIVGAVFVLY